MSQHIILSTLLLGLGSILSSIGGAWIAVYTRYKKFGYAIMFVSMIVNLLVIFWTGYLLIKLVLIDGISCMKHFKWCTIVSVIRDIVALLISYLVIKIAIKADV